MARYPGATWRPVAGHSDGPMRSHLGVVLHVNQSNGNLYNWVAGPNNMSCHFEVYKSGAIEQYLDTDDSSWCQMAGNADYLSIETEGYDTEQLTDAQVSAIANLLIWCNREHRIPLQLADAPGQTGFGWHGMGGAAWGGHPGCPGTIRRGQRSRILILAHSRIGTPPPAEDDEMKRLSLIQVGTRIYITDRIWIEYIAGMAELRQRQADLKNNGGDPTVYKVPSLLGYGKLVAA